MGAPAPNRQTLGHMQSPYDLGLAQKLNRIKLPRSLLWLHAVTHITTG
jgi:hypothetical protein